MYCPALPCLVVPRLSRGPDRQGPAESGGDQLEVENININYNPEVAMYCRQRTTGIHLKAGWSIQPKDGCSRGHNPCSCPVVLRSGRAQIIGMV